MQIINIPGENGTRIKPKYSHFGKGHPAVICLIPKNYLSLEHIFTDPFLKNKFNCLVLHLQETNAADNLSNLTYCWDWLRTMNPEATQCWAIGVNTGSWIGMQLLMRRPEFQRFITVNPPMHKYDYSFLAPCPCAGLVIEANLIESDDYTEEDKSALLLKNPLRESEKVSLERMYAEDLNENIEKVSNSIQNYVKTWSK